MPISPGSPPLAEVDVVGVGANTIDLVATVDGYPSPDSKQPLISLSEHPGGEVATALVACSRLGWKARYLGCYGNDDRGNYALASLASEEVDVSSCSQRAAPERLSLIIVDGSGRRTVLSKAASELDMHPGELDEQLVGSGRVLLVDCHQILAATRAARLARRARVPTVIDVDELRPGLDDLLAEIDVIITSETFPECFSGVTGIGAALAELEREFRPAVTCVTLGSEGCLAIVGNQEIFMPGFDVSAVDTTGAGDAFRGGFISAWLGNVSSNSVEELLIYANAVAAMQTRSLGAWAGLPTSAEVNRFLKERTPKRPA